MNYLMLICYMKEPAALQGSSIKSKLILNYLKWFLVSNIGKSLNSDNIYKLKNMLLYT